jgi:uncharacterized protein YjbI with pentapeptide repeats
MADFNRADLRGSRFELVELSGPQLRAVDLTGALIRGVDLSRVVMRGVELVDLDPRRNRSRRATVDMALGLCSLAGATS